ncbi:MAG: hypothetical protein ABR907_09685 [Terracidiphilus sp.]|jgi:hypothetical protein
MKMSLRFALVAALVALFASLPSFASLSGGDPHPPTATSSSVR